MNIQELVLGTGLVIATNGPMVQNAGPYYGEYPAILTNYPVIRPFADQPYPWSTLETYPGLNITSTNVVWTTLELPSGTPIEGSELTTETRELEPCTSAAILNPPCPGHWKTNRMTWVFHAGNWSRKAETNTGDITVTDGNQLRGITLERGVYTNMITTNLLRSIVWELGPVTTNVWPPITTNWIGVTSDGRVVGK